MRPVNVKRLLATLKGTEMNPGDYMHVAAHHGIAIGGCGADVFKSTAAASERFEIETEIEVGIKLGLGPSACSCQHFLGGESAAEHLVDLAHWNSRIGANGQQGRLGFLGRFGSGDAEKMPGGVFNVVRIYGTVGFELGATVLVAADIVERDAALPELRDVAGDEPGEVIKPGGRLRKVAILEIGDGTIEDCLRRRIRRLRIGGDGEGQYRG